MVEAIHDHVAAGRPFLPLVAPGDSVEDKVNSIATRMYGASSVQIETAAKRQLKKIQDWGYGNLPVCMAKTQYSFSHDSGMLGAPSGFDLPIREFRLNAGAGFVVETDSRKFTIEFDQNFYLKSDLYNFELGDDYDLKEVVDTFKSLIRHSDRILKKEYETLIK